MDFSALTEFERYILWLEIVQTGALLAIALVGVRALK